MFFQIPYSLFIQTRTNVKKQLLMAAYIVAFNKQYYCADYKYT